MTSAIIAMMMTIASSDGGSSAIDPRSIIDMIEALQTRVEDFQCEYEGTFMYNNDSVKKDRKLREDGLYDTFNGVFVWKAGGDTYCSSLHRFEPEGQIQRDQLVVRARKRESEHYVRPNDAPIGHATIEDPVRVNSDRSGCLGEIFALESIKRLAAMDFLEASISEDQIDGREVKVISFRPKGRDGLFARYWIDLQRGGHAVRRESYAKDNVLVGRMDINLKSFHIDNEEVWMPVWGRIEGHTSMSRGNALHPEEPTSIETIYIVSGTLEFNKHPGPSTFTIDYKPRTQVSDKLRRLQYEFGQQKAGTRPSKREAEAMLKEELAKAEVQKSELVAATPTEGIDWSSWLAWGFGATVLASSIALWVQRRGR